MTFQIQISEVQYDLNVANCEAFFNDETKPLQAVTKEHVLQWLSQMPQESFALEYYEDDCESCPPKPRGKKRLVPYIEGHFYIFSKAQEVVLTSTDMGYEQGIFDQLLAKGEVDDSYIVSLVLCPNCGKFQIEVEQCDM